MRTRTSSTYGCSATARSTVRASPGAVRGVTGTPRYWWKIPPSLMPASNRSASRRVSAARWRGPGAVAASPLRRFSLHGERSDDIVDGDADEERVRGDQRHRVDHGAGRRVELEEGERDGGRDRRPDHRPAQRGASADLRVRDREDHPEREGRGPDEEADRLRGLEGGGVVEQDRDDDREGALRGRHAQEVRAGVGPGGEVDQPGDRGGQVGGGHDERVRLDRLPDPGVGGVYRQQEGRSGPE